MRIGLREANQRFSRMMKAVRKGEEVVLTERGRPIARINSLRSPQRREAAIRRLAEAGLLRLAAKPLPLPPWKPRPLKGVSMARTIREERDSR